MEVDEDWVEKEVDWGLLKAGGERERERERERETQES